MPREPKDRADLRAQASMRDAHRPINPLGHGAPKSDGQDPRPPAYVTAFLALGEATWHLFLLPGTLLGAWIGAARHAAKATERMLRKSGL